MRNYTTEDVLRLAKRVNNPKRAYLLVNPLQAKHMPVSPSEALDMMRAFGMQLADKYPETGLVVGFAETATAIGAAVAACFPGRCHYMHTTREALPEVGEWIVFQEEHSHATEQKLAADGFLKALRETSTVLFVEDEISTGKTLRNMLCRLRALAPQGKPLRMVAACIINRMSDENERLLTEAGILCESLIRIPEEDYGKAVQAYHAVGAEAAERLSGPCVTRLACEAGYADPRKGVVMCDYEDGLQRIVSCASEQLCTALPQGARILVLGTEECMYPSLLLGKALEKQNGCRVFCHSTTRSPIGICDAPEYPIRNGCRIDSFYQRGRNAFIYDLAAYDAAVIVTDAADNVDAALADLTSALYHDGTEHIFFLKM